MVYDSAQHVADARANYAAGVDGLAGTLRDFARGRGFADVVDDLRWSNFLLAYQGEDDRDLQAGYAGAVAAAMDAVAPEWRAAPPRASAGGRRLRVGFASSFFSEGTVGMYFRRWIEGLDRTRFDVFVYHLRVGTNPFAEALAARVDRFRRFEGAGLAPSAVAPAIRADALDLLVFPELGMDATTFALAALKLAPVQACAWGHPVTTGHATIDAYLSCGAMEPDGAAAHYTEALWPLPGIGTSYARPAVPADATPAAARAALGLPPDAPLLLCRVAVQDPPRQRRAVRASPGCRARGEARRVRRAASGADGEMARALRRRLRPRARCRRRPAHRAAAVQPSGVPPHQRRVRRDAGHVALVRGQHQPRRHRRRAPGRHAAGALHARPPERRDAGTGRHRGTRRGRRRRVRRARRAAGDGREFRAAQRAGLAAGAPRVFDDPAPTAALAGVLEALARGG